MKKKTILLLMTGIALTGIAHAASLASWNWYDVNIGAVASVAADTTVLDTASVAAGTPQANSTGKGFYKTRECDDADLASAITSGAGFTLNFTAQEGNIMNLTQLKVVLDTPSTANSPNDVAILFDANENGFDAADAIWSTSTLTIAGETATIDLSALGAAYQGLNAATFRIVAWGAASVYDSLFLGDAGNNASLDPVIELQGTTDSAGQRGTLFVVK